MATNSKRASDSPSPRTVHRRIRAGGGARLVRRREPPSALGLRRCGGGRRAWLGGRLSRGSPRSGRLSSLPVLRVDGVSLRGLRDAAGAPHAHARGRSGGRRIQRVGDDVSSIHRLLWRAGGDERVRAAVPASVVHPASVDMGAAGGRNLVLGVAERPRPAVRRARAVTGEGLAAAYRRCRQNAVTVPETVGEGKVGKS